VTPQDFLLFCVAALLVLAVVLLWNRRSLRRALRTRDAELDASRRAEALTAGQMRVLEMIAADAPLRETLTVLLEAVEAQFPDMLCSVQLLDEAGTHIRHGAAPTLPPEFSQAFDGAPIGPQAGSCGTAVFRREPVFVADIASDPLWDAYRHMALPVGLRACWSTPIFDPQGRVLGTFAIYYRQPGLPRAEHLRLIEAASHTATICINRHRTEEALKESEARFRQVMENIEEVFWMTNAAKTQMLYLSPAYEKIWQRTCASVYADPSAWLDAVHPDDRERVGTDTRTKQSRGDYVEEYRVVRPDGSVRWISERAFPIRDADGKPYRIAGVAEDVTARRELEEQFRQSQKMEAIGALAGGIAHDFNNVLSAINGNAELALQDVGAEHAAQQSIREILKAGSRAKNLVQQILTFTRAQQPQRVVLSLAPVVEETAGFLRVALPSTAELVVSLAPDVPNVLANATQVQQVLLNILTNAWHALGAERGSIEVTLRRVVLGEDAARLDAELHAGVYARLSVRDTGRGMDDATRARIFEPFFTTKSQLQGTGLGLAVAHGIVDGHEGAIVVTSAVGAGSTFDIYFPAASGALAELPAAQPAMLPQGGGQRLLYLDDEEALVMLTTRIFERSGYIVSGFTNSVDALDAFRAAPLRFDLAVTDFNMPGASGLDVAAELMKIRPDMSVVLTSGYVTDELRDQAARVGIRKVIYKPNTVKELCDAVQQVLQETPPAVPRE